LRGIGDTLTTTIRRCDMVGRVETNTFAILIASGSGKDSGVVIQRLQNDLEKLQARFEKSPVSRLMSNKQPLAPWMRRRKPMGNGISTMP
jgi:GGDEF domain-containing protein